MNNPWHHFRQFAPMAGGSVSARQTDWLMACLKGNETSAYGVRYRFAEIRSVEQYQHQVPIVGYEALAPWINNLADGRTEQLFSADVVAFETTGGSHSGGKLIPYSAQGLADFRRELIGWLSALIRQFQLAEGKVYWALSPVAATPVITGSGIPVGGGDALYLGEENLAAFCQLSAVPLTIGSVSDIDQWQLLTLYFLICCDDLRLISVWSPSFLTSLLTALEQRQPALMALLAQGGEVAGHRLPADSAALSRYQHYLAQKDTAVLWPTLAVISCWADASSQPLARTMMTQFPGVYLQPKGLLSTEAIITVPDGEGQPSLCLDSNFYEFLHDNGQVFLASEIEVNGEYSVIVTTNSGLYRYQTGDRVKCIDVQSGKLLLRFMGRHSVCSDLVGEKLSEPFVIRCLNKLQGFAALVPDTEELGYLLLLDEQYRQDNQPWLADVEQQLCSNPQYAYARRLSQLKPLRYIFPPQPVEHYLNWQYRQGKRLGDVKLPALWTNENWREIFQLKR